MKKNWLFIEPFVFIWQNSKHYLFYNSLNGVKILILKNEIMIQIISPLLIYKNSYCVQVMDEIIVKKEIVNFINTLMLNQMGSIVVCHDSERPVNIPPVLILDRSIDNPIFNNEYFDELILENVTELTIQVSDKCNYNCKKCDEYRLQLIHCNKSDNFHSNLNIENLVKQLNLLHLQKINITGGDILSLSNFEYIVNVFGTSNVMKIYNVHYKQIKPSKIHFVFDNDRTSLVRISVHCDDIEKTDLVKQIMNLERYNSRVLWSFVVSSEKELNFSYSVLEEFKSINNEIKPFYNKENEEFIREFVFLDYDDINELKSNKRQIFANQVINRNYFGKLTIQSDGQVYDNLNFNAIGNINDYLEDNVHKIIRDGKSWRWVRSNEMCDDCLYKLLCPPPSNLELVMKSKTICKSSKVLK